MIFIDQRGFANLANEFYIGWCPANAYERDFAEPNTKDGFIGFG